MNQSRFFRRIVVFSLIASGAMHAASPQEDLVAACKRGDLATVRRLLDAKIDVTTDDHAAARQANVNGYAEILRLLRAAGGRETGAAPAAAPNKRAHSDSQLAPSGLSKLLPASAAPARKVGAKLRIAMIAEDDLRAAADLLASSLASSPFELIERGELDRILGEHKLTAQLGADGTRATEIGALLGADALILLRKVHLGGLDSAEMRFVRVSPGIVLDSAYRAWPLADASSWATDAAARLAQLDPQLRDDHAIAIATAPFRPLTDTPAAASLARECLLLLNDRLTHQPGLVLLERESVDLISREQAIGKAGAFWAGSYLLDGTVEPSANDAAQTAITLRLAPIGAGEAKTFTIKGPRAELPRLASELVAQAAAALKLRAAPPSDLQMEAQRYFDESRNLFAVGLPLPAYRAAATAAAFGLDSEEFIEWRLDTALKLLAWQTLKLADYSRFEVLRWNGWSQSCIEQRMDAAEWVHPAEWIDLGVETVHLWQRLLLPALRGDDAAGAATLLARHESVIGGAFAVFHSMDLAAITLDFHNAHFAIPQAVRETLQQALALADAKPAHAKSACTIAIQRARLSGALYRDTPSLVTAFTPLLSRDFTRENVATRVTIRMALLSLDAKTTVTFMAPKSEHAGNAVLLSADLPTPHAPAARLALSQVVARGTTAEDELARAAFDYFQSQNPQQQRANSEKLFDLFWKRRQFFVDTPSAVLFFDQICARVAPSAANAPKFLVRVVQTPQNQEFKRATEMLDLRRKLFLLIAKNAKHPGPAQLLFDSDYHPAEEKAADLQTLLDRVEADETNDEFEQEDVKPEPKADVPKPRPVLRGTPTYAKYPPLKVTHRWTAARTLHGPVEAFQISAPTFDPESNTLWLFGEIPDPADDEIIHACAFEISLPSLKTTAWPLPDFQLARSGNGSGEIHFFPQREVLYAARDGQFLAIGNRMTREWKLNREVQPSGDFARVGGELFFLTQGGGARGMASLSLRYQSLAVLASNRRAPSQTPLDRPDIAAVSLKASATGLIEIITEPFDAKRAGVGIDPEPKPQSLLIYDPARRSWSGPKRIHESDEGSNVFTPLTAAGPPKAYKKQPDSNVWTLQLPRTEMPKVRLPIEFTGLDERPPVDPVAAMIAGRWYWVPQGYFFIDNRPFAGSLVYFIPQSELDTYLDTHKPGEDESHSSPPVPGKK